MTLVNRSEIFLKLFHILLKVKEGHGCQIFQTSFNITYAKIRKSIFVEPQINLLTLHTEFEEDLSDLEHHA